MLDSFLKVACANEEKVAERERLVGKMRQLPEDYLHKLASGEEKLAYGLSPYGDESWLDRFKGSPLFEQALELEKQDLQEQMAEKARYREEDTQRSQRNAARDELCIQKKLLELQLAEAEAGGGEPAPEEMAGEEAPPEEGAPPMEEEAPPVEEPPAEAAPPAAPPEAAPPAPPAEESKPKVDVKVAAARMRMAKIAKERTVGERTLGGLAGGAGGSLLGKGMERIYDAGQMRPGTLGGALPLMGAGAGLLYGARKGKGDKEKKASANMRMALYKMAAGRDMTIGENVGSAALGSIPGWMGARKAVQSGKGTALEGGVRGVAGYAGGAAAGALGGVGAGAALSKVLPSKYQGVAQLGGAALGGIGGAVGGYKALTSKFNKAASSAAAGLAPLAILGGSGYMGHMSGKASARRGEEEPKWGVGKTLGSLIVAPYGAYQVGKSIGHDAQTEKGVRRRSKTAAYEAEVEGRFLKEAIGLGMLAKTVGAAGKKVLGAGVQAAKTTKGFGGSGMDAAKMGLGAVKGTAGQVLPTVGRAAKSYVKSNPMQAAGIAGGVGLAGGYALG